MSFDDRDLKKITLTVLLLALGVLVFLIIKPVILSIIGGLILAYIFFPVYKGILKKVRYENLAAAIVSIFILAIIFVPLWFIIPLLVNRVFELFQLSQELNIGRVIYNLFPSISTQLITQLNATINTATSKLSSLILNSLVDLLVNFAVISLHLALVAFVFFFGLRDGKKLGKFVSELSPLNKAKEKILVAQFKGITESIIYGQIVIGLLQGIFVGIGFLIFGVPNALILATIAVILSIIPVIGPGFVYFPVTIYLIISGSPVLAILFLIYNLVFSISIDHLLRAHLVTRKTKLSQIIVLVGMVGGLLMFGILGLILGPLILAYFLTFLDSYKAKTSNT